MNADPLCPVCHARQWRQIGRREYVAAEASAHDEYRLLRYRVLFEVWFPGRQSVCLTSVLCESCGFVMYLPRPEEADIEGKYSFLCAHDKASRARRSDGPVERRRARQLLGRFRNRLSFGPGSRVLDFGGGDGHLLRDIAAQGAACYLVDYSTSSAPWVTRLGSNQREIPQASRFDAITCVHVIEHVADPVAVLSSLATHLAEQGLMYVEVPMEIWRSAPLHDEPVTHVNFFTPQSLARCLREAGLEPISCGLGSYWYYPGRTLLAVSALARRGAVSAMVASPGDAAAETLAFLQPGTWERVRRYAAAPSTLPEAMLSKARQLLRH